MIFIWLLVAVGAVVVASFVALWLERDREAFDEEVRFHEHAKREREGVRSVEQQARKRRKKRKGS